MRNTKTTKQKDQSTQTTFATLTSAKYPYTNVEPAVV